MTETKMAPPVAEKRPVTETWHGHAKHDDYKWLKAENWQAVMQDPQPIQSAGLILGCRLAGSVNPAASVSAFVRLALPSITRERVRTMPQRTNSGPR